MSSIGLLAVTLKKKHFCGCLKVYSIQLELIEVSLQVMLYHFMGHIRILHLHFSVPLWAYVLLLSTFYFYIYYKLHNMLLFLLS